MSKNYKISYEVLSKDSFKMDSYFKTLNVSQSRLQFMLDSAMTRTVATNFKRDPRYKAIDYMCVGCSVGDRDGAPPADDGADTGAAEGGGGGALNRSRDTEAHILRCPGYTKYRDGLNFGVQTDVLKYFELIINKRIEDEDKRT